MKVRIGTLRRIIAEEMSSMRGGTRGSTAMDPKAYLGMAASSSVSPEQSAVWRDKDTPAGTAKNDAKKTEIEALKARIAVLRKAREEAEERLRALSGGF